MAAQKSRGNYACGHEIKKNVTVAERAKYAQRPCQACKKAGWKPEQIIDGVTVVPPKTIEGVPADGMVSVADAEAVAKGATVLPSALMEAAQSIQSGTPVDTNTLATLADQTTQLQPQTWTPGAYCRQRSRNRRTGTLIGLYALEHADNQIAVPPTPADGKPIRWVAQCENHGARYFHNSVNDAWSMRNQPWLFCPGCQAIVDGKAASLTTKTPSVKVEAKPKKVKVAARASTPKAPKSPKAKKPGSDSATADSTPANADGVLVDITSTVAAGIDQQQAADLAQQVAIQEPTPPSAGPQDDPESKAWTDWSQKLASQAPAGTSVDWLGAYHYSVDLPGELPDVELFVKGDLAVFKARVEGGKDEYADTFAEMLDKLGVPV